jgi:hypothetical protein
MGWFMTRERNVRWRKDKNRCAGQAAAQPRIFTFQTTLLYTFIYDGMMFSGASNNRFTGGTFNVNVQGTTAGATSMY